MFNQPLAKTQRAAVDALTVIGCDIKKQEPAYVEGHRPLKAGLVVGSGNETVRVAMKEIIDVHESRSSVGETRIYHVTATGIRYKESR